MVVDGVGDAVCDGFVDGTVEVCGGIGVDG